MRLNDGLLMRNQGLIDSEAFGVGNGGNILINAPVIIGIEDSDIVANAVAVTFPSQPKVFLGSNFVSNAQMKMTLPPAQSLASAAR
ncbi:MAG: hypothetical protein AAF703_10880 [Cyanobacteria bacterium P01_D01_bin.105]